MDRNSIIGVVLIVVIILIYGIMSQPSKEQIQARKRTQDSMMMAQQIDAAKQHELNALKDSADKREAHLPDSTKNKALESQFGVFAGSTKDSNQFIILENNLLKVKVSTKGGRPYSVQLKKFTRFDSTALVLFDGDSTEMGLNFFSQNKSISTNNLFFKPVSSIKEIFVKDKSDSVALRLYAGENSYIEYVYSIKPNDYMIRFNVNFVNMDKIIANNSNTIDLNWSLYIPRQERGEKNEDGLTNIHYKHFQDDDEAMSATSSKPETKEVTTKLKWIAFKQQFFSSVIVAGESFNNASLNSISMVDKTKHLKKYTATIALNYQNKPSYSVPMSFYFGPNHFLTLKKYNIDLEKLVVLGKNVIRVVNQWIIIPIFNFLSNFISSFGLIILLLTLIIKIGLFPLTFKSYQSQAKMRVLKPQIDEINKKIPKEKAMERQQATMGLYKKAGVNPLGGCLPMLLQFPILIAMFRFFPASIELRHQSFLWATDLSTYDSIMSLPFTIPYYGNHISLFTILMTVTTIISMKMSQTTMTDNQIPGMKTMMYIMPVMFMFMLNSFSAGLTYYYFLANMITIGQNEVFKLMINEEKLLKQIQANKAKPAKKKSGFQERLEKMAKERGMNVPKKK